MEWSLGTGLIVDTPASVTISDLAFQGGNAKSQPGLIQNQGTLTLRSCTISGNTSSGGMSTVNGTFVAYGGGSILNSGTLAMTNSTVSGNTSPGGSGIENLGSLTMTGSTVSGNGSSYAALYMSPGGGGIRNRGTLTMMNSTVSGNTSSGNGGGIYLTCRE